MVLPNNNEKTITYISLASEKTLKNSIHGLILGMLSKNFEKVLVLCKGEEYTKEEGNIIYLSGGFKKWFNNIKFIPEKSFIFATDFFVGGAFAAYLKRKKSCKLILRAASPWAYSGFSPITLIKRLVLQITKPRVIKNSDKVIYNSKAIVQHQYKHDYTVVYNGVDTELFKPMKVNPISPKLNLIAIGNINKEKGLDYLFEAVKNMTDKVHLSIVGDGPLLEKYKKKYPFAKYFGKVEQKDLPYIINQHDVLVHPSYVESMPNVVLEAMACGKPVIAAKVFGVPEMIQEGVNGFLVPSKDSREIIIALNNFLEKPQLIKEMGKKVRKAVKERFEKGKQIQKLYNLLIK